MSFLTRVVLALLLTGWAASAVAASLPAAAQRRVTSPQGAGLLGTLTQRLDEIAAAAKSNKALRFDDDPDLAPLLGVSKTTLREALGASSIDCRSKPAVSAATGERLRIAPCRSDDDLAYAFHTLPRGSVGGGPVLLLQFNVDAICRRAIWRRTQ